ncbi:MAG: Nif3-like dinuclear metal center hexameric protein, partial [Schwartzia succinivorans]|nr:Nif3-like dinuclear metal center hexameric protein [Schwartzia succinivorans]
KLPAPIEAKAFAEQVKKGLGAINVRFVSGGEHPVKKVGLCSGSGAEFIERAAFMGCDAFVTGDVRYHDAQRAAALGIHVIDAGHFATEQPIVEILATRLSEELVDKVEVIADDYARDFFETI